MKVVLLTFSLLFLLAATALSQVVEFNIKVDKVRFQPDSISVRKGDRVMLKVTSVDEKAHGLTLEDFGLKKVVIPAKETVNIEFLADKEGVFVYRCSKYCSFRHLFFAQPKLTIEVNP